LGVQVNGHVRVGEEQMVPDGIRPLLHRQRSYVKPAEILLGFFKYPNQ
jgi:hypothetical protein